MRIGVIARGPLEWLAARLGYVPEPFLLTQPALVQARALVAGCEVGVFDALADAPRSATAVADALGTDGPATTALLDALAGIGYLRRRTPSRGGASDEATFRLTRKARRWLTTDSPTSLVRSLAFRRDEWAWLCGLSDFVRTGAPLDFHATMDAAAWRRYQAAMDDLARLCAPSLLRHVGRRLPRRAGARTLLDIGGASGTYAAALCRALPNVCATVVDLPAAVAHAAAPHGLAGRLRFVAGDVRRGPLPAPGASGGYDLVLVSQLLHHLDAPACADLVARAAGVLRPGGLLVVQDVFRTDRADALASLAALYFAFTSRSGAWRHADVAAWQAAAGLVAEKPVAYRTVPGVGLQVARR